MLVDDFEDGDIAGWNQYLSGSCNGGVSVNTPDGSNYSMLIIGECGQLGGYYYDFVDFQATSVSVDIRPGSTTVGDAFFLAGEYGDNIANNAIYFFASYVGQWQLSQPSGISKNCGYYSADQWYHFVFTINWSTKKVSVSKDGVECITNADFSDPSTTTLNRVILKNYQNSYAFWDNIILAAAPPAPPIFADGFESGDTSYWSNTIP